MIKTRYGVQISLSLDRLRPTANTVNLTVDIGTTDTGVAFVTFFCYFLLTFY